MKYIINSVEGYSDGKTPKIGVNVSAFDEDIQIANRLIVIPLDILKENIDLKDASNSLLALVEKFAQKDPELNLDNLKRLKLIRDEKEAARVEAQAFADLINEAVVVEKPEIIEKAEIIVDILPVKVRPEPIIEPIEEPIEIIKEAVIK